MGPKKARKNVRNIEVSTDTLTVFELADTAADIKRRENKERGRSQRRGEDEGGSLEGENSTGRMEEAVAEKKTKK